MPSEELLSFVRAGVEGVSGSGSAAFQAAAYHLDSGGKRARLCLALEAARLVDIPEPDCRRLAACVELLHNSSLVFDDMQDRDRERRGRPAVWVKYGPDVALCAGALLLSAAYGALSGLSHRELVGELVAHAHGRTGILIHGQTADLTADHSSSLTPEAYEQIAAEKSGVLFSLPLELAALYSGRAESISKIEAAARTLAVGYQIADDVADFVSDLSAEGAGRLNYVVMLSREIGAGKALDAARGRSLGLLEDAHREASRIPSHIGLPLMRLAELLSDRV